MKSVTFNCGTLFSKNSRSWEFIFEEKSLFEISQNKYQLKITRYMVSVKLKILLSYFLKIMPQLLNFSSCRYLRQSGHYSRTTLVTLKPCRLWHQLTTLHNFDNQINLLFVLLHYIFILNKNDSANNVYSTVLHEFASYKLHWEIKG